MILGGDSNHNSMIKLKTPFDPGSNSTIRHRAHHDNGDDEKWTVMNRYLQTTLESNDKYS
jgi:hypothetical protein